MAAADCEENLFPGRQTCHALSGDVRKGKSPHFSCHHRLIRAHSPAPSNTYTHAALLTSLSLYVLLFLLSSTAFLYISCELFIFYFFLSYWLFNKNGTLVHKYPEAQTLAQLFLDIKDRL